MKVGCPNIPVEYEGKQLDTFSVDLVINLCVAPKPMSIEFKFSETKEGFTYDKTYASAETVPVPIPGLSIGVSGLSIDAEAEVGIDVTDDNVHLMVAVDACVTIPVVGKKCGHDFDPTDLPVSREPALPPGVL